jgi:hypothetical protein
MRTTRREIAELGGLSASIIAAIIGVFVIAATQVAYNGWATDIRAPLTRLDSGAWPADVTRDPGPDSVVAANRAGASLPAAGASVDGGPAGSITPGPPVPSPTATGVETVSASSGLITATVATGHAHAPATAQPTTPSAPPVTQGDGSGSPQSSPGKGQGPQSNPNSATAAPAAGDTDTLDMTLAPQGQAAVNSVRDHASDQDPGRGDSPPEPPDTPAAP